MTTQRSQRLFLLGLASWLVAGVIVLLQFRPRVPSGWVVFLAIGPPLYLLLEALAGWLFSEQHGAAISGAPFSPLRVLVALVGSLAVVGACLWFLSLVGAQ